MWVVVGILSDSLFPTGICVPLIRLSKNRCFSSNQILEVTEVSRTSIELTIESDVIQ